MKVVIDISEYNMEWIKNGCSIPPEINTVIAESIIDGEEYTLEPQWVSCNDRLPWTCNNVLLRLSNGEEMIGHREGFRWYVGRNPLIHENVVEWRPLS